MGTMAGKKVVAVIGAGPSGLVAAKSMLELGLSPVVFDKALEVGGMWNPNSRRCWDSMRTNISRHSCCFSDFPWECTEGSPPLFPSQHQMYEYLEKYTNKFLLSEHFSLGSEVTKVSRSADGKWVVEWRSLDQEQSFRKEFDFVVFASGFYGQPNTPDVPGLDAFGGEVMYSSEYRGPDQFRGKRVAVVGASFSSAEVAAEIAPHAAQVINLVHRRVWILPRCVAAEPASPATPFFPLDLVFYRYSASLPEKFVGASTEELYKRHNQHLRTLCGDQGILNPSPEQDTEPPFIAISDDYNKLVRSNRIDVRLGKLQKVQGRALVLEDGAIIDDIDSIIFCTGFRSSLTYLRGEILDSISFDPTDKFLSVLLHRSIFHPSLPGSAFVGFYRGPFMGIMELQARWAAAVFSGTLPSRPDAVLRDGIRMERRMKVRLPRPQFPHEDYVLYAKVLAKELEVFPPDNWCNEHDIVIPAHFRTGCAAEKALADLEKECEELSAGKMVPHAVLRSLAGAWAFRRRIDNRMNHSQSGTVTGTATFTATASPHEYLYSETGELALAGGKRFRVYRKYVYAYDMIANRIDVFFENQGSRSYLFHSLKFLPPGSPTASEKTASTRSQSKIPVGWRAEGQHGCGEDMYYPSYLFQFQGNELGNFEISYAVDGPQKSYTSTASYVRGPEIKMNNSTTR